MPTMVREIFSGRWGELHSRVQAHANVFETETGLPFNVTQFILKAVRELLDREEAARQQS